MRLKNFDSVFCPDAADQKPSPKATDEERDLAQEIKIEPEANHIGNPCSTPPSQSEEDFKTQFPTIDATITLNVGSNITCFLVGGKVFLLSPAKIILPGCHSENAKPLFMYAGGSWISESAKVSWFQTNVCYVSTACLCRSTMIAVQTILFCIPRPKSF